jgi:hypothetical protein
MICPHCNKEVDSYTVYGQGTTLKYEDGTGGDAYSYNYTVADAGETTFTAGEFTLTPAISVPQEVTLGHYHLLEG